MAGDHHERRRSASPGYLTSRLRITYIGSEASDPATQRRCRRLSQNGASMQIYAFERDASIAQAQDFTYTSLGVIEDGRMGSRIFILLHALWRMIQNYRSIRYSDVIYCRNLDCALIGLVLRIVLMAKADLVYEVLDIHPLVVREDRIGRAVRSIERIVLGQISLLVVSSPYFVSKYFEPTQGFDGAWFVMENKIAWDMPERVAPEHSSPQPIVLGYFGKLRSAESLEVLRDLANACPLQVKIVLGGIPEPHVREAFDGLLTHDNVEFLGEYHYPYDLPRLYGSIDLNWGLDLGGDFNARVLLPNRIYEGGYFGVPLIAEEGTATGDYVREKGIGLTISEPFAASLVNLATGISADELARLRSHILSLPTADFIDIDEHGRLLDRLAETVSR